MADMIYQVIGWEENFEGGKSKTYNHKSACQMPTKHGLGYRRLVRRPNGPALFGAWCALIQLLSRQSRPRQGYLTDTGGDRGRPLVAVDCEVLTDIPAAIFEELFQVAASQDVGWLVAVRCDRGRSTVRPQCALNSDSDSDLDSDLDSDSTADNDHDPIAAYCRIYTDMLQEVYAIRPRSMQSVEAAMGELRDRGVTAERVRAVCGRTTMLKSYFRGLDKPEAFAAEFAKLETAEKTDEEITLEAFAEMQAAKKENVSNDVSGRSEADER